MNIREVGVRLRNLRESRGMAQKDAASAIALCGFHTTPSNLSRIENGLVKSVDAMFLTAAARCFDVPLAYLAEGGSPAGDRLAELAAQFQPEAEEDGFWADLEKSRESCKTTFLQARVSLLIFSQCLNASIAILFTTSSVCKPILMKAS